MLKRLLEAIGLGGPEHEAKTLAKDARQILSMVHEQHAAPSQEKIAQIIRAQIDEVHRRGLNDPQYYGQGIKELTELNRAARARRDNAAWSGITLAIIYIKSEMLGDVGVSARNAIDGFLETWAHALNDDTGSGTGPGTGDDPSAPGGD